MTAAIIHITIALSRGSQIWRCSATDKRVQPAAPPTRSRNARAGEVTSFSAK
jgi:hypothetical protein